FGDRDLFMRNRGGGVGHSTRAFTQELEREATMNDTPLPNYDPATGEILEDVPEDLEVGEDPEEQNEHRAFSDEDEISSLDGSSSDEPGLDIYDSNDSSDEDEWVDVDEAGDGLD
ncbi:hypothetical protein PM082_016000, partial [Marasmius tenuissimus]